MTIRSSAELPVIKCVEIKRDRRFGFMQEDDIALTIRRFSLDAVGKREDTDPNTNTVMNFRDVTFTEAEIEYEYWYVNYGKGFRNPEGLKVFSASRSIEYNEADTYNDIIMFCVNQSSMADLPFFTDHVADAFNHTTVCDAFPVYEA